MSQKKAKTLPVGILLMALLLGGSGISLLWILGKYWREIDPALLAIADSSPFHALMSFVFLGVLYFGAGLGLLFGKKWGWWWALFAMAYGILRSINVLAYTYGIFGDFELSSSQISEYTQKHLVRMIGYGLLGFYLLRLKIKQFFEVSQISTSMVIWKVSQYLGITIVIGFLVLSIFPPS